MAPQPARSSKSNTAGEQRPLSDRRRHKRIGLPLLGRFMRAGRQEYPCKLKDISVGGAALMAPVDVELGERIVAYVDQVGGLEGHVVRGFEGGFAIRLAATPHKREKLAAQLTWLLNRTELASAQERRPERLITRENRTGLQLAEGLIVPCDVLDVSVSGARLRTDARPDVGKEVEIGRAHV